MTPNEKWNADRPVNLTELAKIQGVSYATARRWSLMPNFPRVGNLLRRTGFEAWWKKAERQHTPARPPRSGVDKSCAQPAKSDSRAALPPKAARLLGEAS